MASNRLGLLTGDLDTEDRHCLDVSMQWLSAPIHVKYVASTADQTWPSSIRYNADISETHKAASCPNL